MKPNLLMSLLLPVVFTCQGTETDRADSENPFPDIGSIPLPKGFSRVATEKQSFAQWLRLLPLKKNKTVYLYNGRAKENQEAQFAVIDISVGTKDLQQCADAVMRLRAEYLFALHRSGEIHFYDNARNDYHPSPGRDLNRKSFDEFLEKVFAHCGTLSLERQLHPVRDIQQVAIGDVLIQGGSPGHAMLVVDEASDQNGHKIFLLAQSYMPAQDIHVVRNLHNADGSPWYEAVTGPIETPEWTFRAPHFRRW